MNRLAKETSPYLRQHADNPVDWYPWGSEAFEQARALDRPIMLSVGYSSCHWCHVMAHESFEDEQTAEELNARFVAVKVDREERPDVDAIYMEAVQALSGRGGWPMTVFLTPDGRPFFAGTYYPARDLPAMPGFRRVLDAVDEAWRSRRDEVEQQADALLEAVSQRTRLPEAVVEPAPAEDVTDGPREAGANTRSGRAGRNAGSSARARGLVDRAVTALGERFDPRWGGFGGAPKFPHPALVELCLQHHRLSGDEAPLSMAVRTLQAMAAGGIYDHLGGGFHRYAVDETWTVPHFEKMLYDQAGLVRTYLHAWQATAQRQWLSVAEETIGYVLAELALASGGLSSAEDADSEGEEGRFYLWTPAQIAGVLGAQNAAPALEWYGVTEAGNFEGRSILRRPVDGSLLRTPELDAARKALSEARATRVRPGRDDKVLTEWNAMFGTALAEAAAATGRDDWARAAIDLGQFLLASLRRHGDGRWLRSWQDGRAQHLAYAADHAWLVDFFTRLAELTGRASWLEHAQETARSMLELFWEPGSPLYTTGTDAERLVVRPMELADGATPSATSVAAAALLRLGALAGDHALTDAGEEMVSVILELFARQPLAVACTLSAGMLGDGGITEVVVGGDRPDLLTTARTRYEPTQVIAWGERTGSPLWDGKDEPLAYVCRHFTCQAPSATPEDLAGRLDAERDEERARFGAARREVSA